MGFTDYAGKYAQGHHSTRVSTSERAEQMANALQGAMAGVGRRASRTEAWFAR